MVIGATVWAGNAIHLKESTEHFVVGELKSLNVSMKHIFGNLCWRGKFSLPSSVGALASESAGSLLPTTQFEKFDFIQLGLD